MNTQVIKREGTPREIVIKSARNNGRLITVANIHDGAAIFTGPPDEPLKFVVCIPREDIHNLIKALQLFAHEVSEENSI